MRIIKKALILIMAVILAVSTFFNTNVKATAIGTEYVQKVVSVVYDNSGSMEQGIEGEQRYQYAAYALKMLVGLMNENDKMVITPMNNSYKVDKSYEWQEKSIVVDLKNEDRNTVVDNLFYDPLTEEASSTKIPELVRGAGTPYNSINKAINAFEDLTGKPLPTDETYTSEDSNYEYWLVILTDGKISEQTYTNKDELSKALQTTLEPYCYLNTVYYAFGTLNEIYDLTDDPITMRLPFTAYKAGDGNEIINNMQDIANKLSRRFALDESYISFDGKKIIIDLDYFSSNYLSFKSLSIIAQNSGVKLKTVKYNGKEIKLKRQCVLDSYGINNMKNGFLGVIDTGESFNGGRIELFFESIVQTTKKNSWFGDKDETGEKSELYGKIKVLVEPALELEAYYIYENQEIDMAYVNSNLTKGDKVKVSYRIKNPLDGSEITDFSAFGEAEATVTYNGIVTGAGENITLVVGRNAINLEVKFKQNNYSLLTSNICVVEVNPTIYAVKSYLDESNSQIKFTAEYDGCKKTKAELEQLKISVRVVNPLGAQVSDDYIINDNGEIIVDVEVAHNVYGRYEIYCKVVFSEEDRIERTAKQELLELPETIEIDCLNNTELTIGEYNLKTNQNKISFLVKGDGNEINVDKSLYDYKIEIDGVDITNKVHRSKGLFTFIPNTESLPDASVGTKTITLTVNGVSKSFEFIIEPTKYTIEKTFSELTDINIYKLRDIESEVRFKVLRNGVCLSYDELFEILENEQLKIDLNAGGWLRALPAGVDISIELFNGEPEIVCKVVNDGFKFLWIDKLAAALMSTKDKTIELEYSGATCSQTFTFTPVSAGSRILRIFILVLYILFTIHLILYLLGFLRLFGCNAFEPGSILSVSMGYSIAFDVSEINMSSEDIIKWHLKRFIPGMWFKPQTIAISQVRRAFGNVGELIIDKSGDMKVKLEEETYFMELNIPNNKLGVELQNYVIAISQDPDNAFAPQLDESFVRKLFIGQERLEYKGNDGDSENFKISNNQTSNAISFRVYFTKDERRKVTSFATYIKKK